ncbi:MAG: sulfur carrier protein ThiS [Acidobacteria bacterium]|nr:sulfur carrier protein ThiS [Acidobacteriota bacterium]
MTLVINGENRTLPAVSNVLEMLSQLGIAPDRIAVELNGRIVRRRDWAVTAVSDRDKVEIVQFVGGG